IFLWCRIRFTGTARTTAKWAHSCGRGLYHRIRSRCPRAFAAPDRDGFVTDKTDKAGNRRPAGNRYPDRVELVTPSLLSGRQIVRLRGDTRRAEKHGAPPPGPAGWSESVQMRDKQLLLAPGCAPITAIEFHSDATDRPP